MLQSDEMSDGKVLNNLHDWFQIPDVVSIKGLAMRMYRLLAVAACLGLGSFQSASAGSPLKGIDVKLGKNPGGGLAARTTDANGNADFGVLPKGNYTVSVSPGLYHAKVHVVVRGSARGVLTREFDTSKSARITPMEFSMDGRARLRVSLENTTPIVGAAKVKSHSNSTNN